MSLYIKVTGRLVAAARALSGISREDLAKASGLSVKQLARIEASGSAALSPSDSEAVSRALEDFGTVLIPEGDGLGAGVRLKFLRQDVKQLGRWEAEGGVVREDDVP